MKTLIDKYAIIKLKKEGYSNRKVASILYIDRKTVGRYWNEYLKQVSMLKNAGSDINAIQEKICGSPKYNVSNRVCRKYTKEMDLLLDEILKEEENKLKIIGNKKQQLSQIQIHQIFIDKGFEISLSTIANKIREKRNKVKECFIRQDYDFGDRLEYDFGEVSLEINGILEKYYMAVLSSPASNFRWAYLYKNQKKDVFMDSQVKFFEMVKGSYKEVVYDNMKNVVTRFIGRHEKELNSDLLKLSIYYGFDINVTNCFSGNEKGHVEGSVKIIRNKVFAKRYKFKTLEEAETYLNNELIELNKGSQIEEEVNHLLPYRPMLELADIKAVKVDKYGFVRISNNFYSVPDYLIDRLVTAKVYYDKIIIYSNNHLVCEHKKVDGVKEISIDINHYLNTFTKKPGAIRNSLALKSLPELKSIYDIYFSKNPKKFIELIKKNRNKNLDELVKILLEYKNHQLSSNVIPLDLVRDQIKLGDMARKQTSKYNQLCIKGKGSKNHGIN